MDGQMATHTHTHPSNRKETKHLTKYASTELWSVDSQRMNSVK